MKQYKGFPLDQGTPGPEGAEGGRCPYCGARPLYDPCTIVDYECGTYHTGVSGNPQTIRVADCYEREIAALKEQSAAYQLCFREARKRLEAWRKYVTFDGHDEGEKKLKDLGEIE